MCSMEHEKDEQSTGVFCQCQVVSENEICQAIRLEMPFLCGFFLLGGICTYNQKWLQFYLMIRMYLWQNKNCFSHIHCIPILTKGSPATRNDILLLSSLDGMTNNSTNTTEMSLYVFQQSERTAALGITCGRTQSNRHTASSRPIPQQLWGRLFLPLCFAVYSFFLKSRGLWVGVEEHEVYCSGIFVCVVWHYQHDRGSRDRTNLPDQSICQPKRGLVLRFS